MALKDKSFLCRKCKVRAHAHVFNDEIQRVSCPKCGILIEGDEMTKMIRDAASYFMGKQAQDMFRRALSGSKSITYKPGKLYDPSGPFLIG